MGIIDSDFPCYFLLSFNDNFNNNIWLNIYYGDYPNEKIFDYN